MWGRSTAVSLKVILVLLVTAPGSWALTWHLEGTGWGIYLPLPPGSTLQPWTDALAKVELPFPTGTTLRELFLILKLVSQGRGEPIRVKGHVFFFRREGEGAAGTLYEVFSYSTPLPDGFWLELIFVAAEANPSCFDDPPPAVPLEALVPRFLRILGGLRVVKVGGVTLY